MVAINRLTEVKIWGDHLQALPTKHLKKGSITTVGDFSGQFLLLRFFWENHLKITHLYFRHKTLHSLLYCFHSKKIT